ncbi:trigger factor [Methylomonas paludis]|uniref:Trigger factor n=1 Tax=Methylomonas paludis TaxID=1173101 RepID=A0A975R9S8_9GAMM|nr:trigger factor [Methylomonas paludis]QWF71387.1 trigger factor [Methylomonas paludis]
MQVSVEKTSELNRKMTVSIPHTVFEAKIETRLKTLAKEVKIDGFRPGKAPSHVVKRLYGERVLGEVTGDLIQTTYFEALQQQELVPAGQPHIHPSEVETGFEYIAEFEVYPEIALDGITQLTVTRPLAEVTEADVDNMILKLRQQKKTWQSVERASEAGDQITINFTGVAEGENFTNGKAENFKVEIGASQMIPGFEDQLLGLAAGGVKTFSLAFPENYNNQQLAGKTAEFEVEVLSVEAPILPEVDAEFIKAYGVEEADINSFRADVRNNMERELVQGLKSRLKNSVLDTLYDSVSVTLPNVLVDQELQNVLKPYAERAKQLKLKLEDLQLPVEAFENQARRRVALGLILGEIIRKNEITIDAGKVRSVIEDMAKSYEKPEDVVNWYYADKERLNDVQQMVLEDQAVDWIVGQSNIGEVTLSFSEVMEKQQIEA